MHTITSFPRYTSEAVRVPLPTTHGTFDVRAFERPSGDVYVAMVLGDIVGADDVLVRLHSECLTGDVLGSLRCDCGVQLRLSLRRIAAEGQGVLIYATGHEGRGIGLVNKLRAYVAQDAGADTVDANVLLGLPVDSRDYTDSAEILAELEIRSIRLLTNNPRKVDGLRTAGAVVNEVVPLPTAPHHRNADYLSTKARRLDHVRPTGRPMTVASDVMNDTVNDTVNGTVNDTARDPSPECRSDMSTPTDVMALLGTVRPHAQRPFVVLKYAQSLDGRIATADGDSKWISGAAERRTSHALRAAVDAVLVGVGTAIHDDPELTVRMVSGASPMRVVLDSSLRIPDHAKLLGTEAATTIITSERSDPDRRAELRRRGVRVEVVPERAGRLDLAAVLTVLRASGTESLLVEGGAEVITALLAEGLVDRVIVGVAPIVLGAGTQAVNDLGTERVVDGIRLENRSIVVVDDDVLLAWDVGGQTPPAGPGSQDPAT